MVISNQDPQLHNLTSVSHSKSASFNPVKILW
jgi:hypothetical protein